MAVWSPVLGHAPPALLSITGHLRPYLAPHLVSASVRADASPVRANFASALCRQRAYFPASLFLSLSHFWAGVGAASAVPTTSRATAAPVVVRKFLVIFLVLLCVGPREGRGRVACPGAGIPQQRDGRQGERNDYLDP